MAYRFLELSERDFNMFTNLVIHKKQIMLWFVCLADQLFASDKSRYFAQPRAIAFYYHSFKIFPRFWLVKNTRITHHNQLLLNKFGKNFVILNQWRQKCSPLQFATSFPGSSLYLENVPVLSRGSEKTAGTMLCSLLNCWPRKSGDEVMVVHLFQYSLNLIGRSEIHQGTGAS